MATIVAACLFGAVALGIRLRRVLPEQHFNVQTRRAVNLAMGLVGTMSAVLLGLLLSSAKSGYDAERKQVIQMAAKVAFLNQVLGLYGPEATESRTKLRAAIEEAVRRIWPKDGQSGLPTDFQAGDAVYAAIESLSPRDDMQRSLKGEAVGLAMELGDLRSVIAAESVPSLSRAMLVIVVCWLVAIFLSFSLLSPPNDTATHALIVSAYSVASAFFLILELDEPFGGLIQISREPLLNALSQFAK
jgi:hypothetical protein